MVKEEKFEDNEEDEESKDDKSKEEKSGKEGHRSVHPKLRNVGAKSLIGDTALAVAKREGKRWVGENLEKAVDWESEDSPLGVPQSSEFWGNGGEEEEDEFVYEEENRVEEPFGSEDVRGSIDDFYKVSSGAGHGSLDVYHTGGKARENVYHTGGKTRDENYVSVRNTEGQGNVYRVKRRSTSPKIKKVKSSRKTTRSGLEGAIDKRKRGRAKRVAFG